MSAWWRAAAKTHRSFHLMSHKVARRPPFASQSGVFFFAPPPLPPFPPFPPSPGTKPRALSKAMGMPPRRALHVGWGPSEAGGATLPCPACDHPRLNPHSARSGADLPQNRVLLPIPRRKCHSTHAQPTTRNQPREPNHAHSTTHTHPAAARTYRSSTACLIKWRIFHLFVTGLPLASSRRGAC